MDRCLWGGGAGGALGPPALAVATIAVPCRVTALRNAITAAPGNAILVLKGGCFYRLTAALPTITRNLTIQGSNDTITVSSGTFTILTNNGASVTVSQTRFTGADATAAAGMPGAIDNTGGGTVTVQAPASTFADNVAAHFGGAIASIFGTLSITRAAFTGNQAGKDGGAVANLGAAATIAQSGFTGNLAGMDGGAVADRHRRQRRRHGRRRHPAGGRLGQLPQHQPGAPEPAGQLLGLGPGLSLTTRSQRHPGGAIQAARPGTHVT